MTTVAAAVRHHHFENQTNEVLGVINERMVCKDCGADMRDVVEGEECPSVDLTEATEDVRKTPKPKKKHNGEEVIATVAKAMGAMAEEAQHVEAADKADNGVDAPPAPRLPFPAPPFDSILALERIFSKQHAVTAARATFEKKQAAAKEAKGEWETLVADLSELIAKYEQDKRDAEASVQPRLVPVPREEPTDGTLLCAFEKSNGQPCPLCRNDGRYETADTDLHRLEAEQAFNANRTTIVKLMNAAEQAGWNLRLETIEGFTEEQRERLQAWIDHGGAGVEPPPILGRPHIAGEPGTSVQPCAVCGCVLVDLTKDEAFPIPDKVGVDCEGPAVETIAEA